MSAFPEIEKMRARARAKIDEVRSRFGTQFGTQRLISPQMRIGGGQLANRARTRLNQMTGKVQERRPGVITQVKEFKPGERVRRVMQGTYQKGSFRPDITSLPEPTRSGRGFSVAEEPAKPFDHREIVVEM